MTIKPPVPTKRWRVKAGDRMSSLPQRALFQAWRHAERVMDFLLAARDPEAAPQYTGDTQDLIEAMESLNQTMGCLRSISKKHYERNPEDLAVYR